MPRVPVRIGRRYGAPFRGLNEKTADSAQVPGDASGGMNFQVTDGVLEPRGGTTWSTDVARPTSYYVTMDGTDGIKFPYIAAYDLMVRWTIVLSFRTPAAFSGTSYLFAKRLLIGSTEYHYPSIYVNSAGKVFVQLTSAAGGDKTFDSGSSVLSTSTQYVMQVMRYDTEAFLYWGTPTVSPAVKGSTDELGKINYPEDAGGGYPITVGADYTGAAYANGGAFQLHELTVLSKTVTHQDFGYTSFAAPRDRDCVLHVRFEDASGTITDLSANGNDSDDQAGIASYQDTTNAFVEESGLIQMVKEFTNTTGQQRILMVTDGSVVAANYHI